MAGDPLKMLSKLTGSFKGGDVVPLATSAKTISVVHGDKPGKGHGKAEGGRGRRKRGEGETTAQGTKKGKGGSAPSSPKKNKTIEDFVHRAGKLAEKASGEQKQQEGTEDPLAASSLNIFDDDLDMDHPDLDSVFLSGKTLDYLGEADLGVLVRQSLHNQLKDFLVLKYLDQSYISALKRRVEIREMNKQHLRELREAYAGQEEKLKEAEVIAKAALKDKEGAEKRLKTAEGEVFDLKAKISNLEAEVRDLKDTVNKERDEAEKNLNLAAKEWETEKGTIVEAMSSFASQVEKVILQQVQIRNPGVGLDYRGISAMYLVEDGKIYRREKADEVTIPEIVEVNDVEPSQTMPDAGAEEKGDDASFPTST